MKTINTVLPVYDKLIKQCYERSKHVCGDKEMIVPVITPRWRFPAMQWNVEDDDPGELIGIELINQQGISTDILNYFNRNDKYIADYVNISYDVFSDPGPPTQAAITDAQKTVAAGEEHAGIVLYEGAVTQRPLYDYTYQPVRIDVTLTLTSGTAPKMELRDSFSWDITYSNTVTLAEGRNIFFLTPLTNTGTQLSIIIFNGDTELTRFSLAHNNLYGMYACHPRLFTNSDGDEYFMYNNLSIVINPVLKYLLNPGLYYLKFTSLNGYIYYSDWFLVDCVYKNLIEGWTNFNYDTFEDDGTILHSVIRLAGNATAYSSNTFQVFKDKSYTCIFFYTHTSGSYPTIQLYDGGTISNIATPINGLNVITLTATANSDEAYLVISNATPTEFSMTEVILISSYSEKYLTLEFSHSCNLGDIIYEDDFEQILFLKAETMEPVFPYTEKGQENGYGQFIPTFQRQEKNWLIKTLLIPQFIVDVLHRLKLHDSITLTDLVGDEWIVKGIDVEHEWQFSDKYYATATLTVDLGEEIVTTACCTDINECP